MLLVVGGLIQSDVGVFVDVLLDGVGDDLRFLQQPVPLGFLLGGIEEQRHHLASVGDDRILCGQQLVRRRKEGVLNLLVGQVRGAAALPAVVLVVALPDHPAVLVGRVPDLRAVPAAALAAADFAGEGVNAAVVLLALAALGHLPLNHVELLRRDDRLVVSLHVVLRDLALVLLLLLRQVIDREALLQQGIAFVLLVREDAPDRGDAPLVLAAGRLDPLGGELLRDAVVGLAREEHVVDAPDDLGLLGVDNQLAVGTTVVAEEPVERDRDLPVGEPLPLSPCAVLGDAAAFLLRQRAHDGDEQLALAVESPDVLLLEIALDAFLLELPDGRQAVHGVAGEAADALGDDEVDLSGQSVGDHPLEALAALGGCARDALVGVDVHELPVVPALDVVGVVVDLRLVAGELVVVVGGDAGVPGYPALSLLRDWGSGEARQRCRDRLYFLALVDAQYLSLLIFFMVSLIFRRRSSVKLALMAAPCFFSVPPSMRASAAWCCTPCSPRGRRGSRRRCGRPARW